MRSSLDNNSKMIGARKILPPTTPPPLFYHHHRHHRHDDDRAISALEERAETGRSPPPLDEMRVGMDATVDRIRRVEGSGEGDEESRRKLDAQNGVHRQD